MSPKISRETKTLIRYRVRRVLGEIPPGERQRKFHMLNAYRRIIGDGRVETVLDAGSGDGVYSFWLSAHLPNARIDAWDIDEERVRGCQIVCDKYCLNGIEFAVKDLNDLNAEEKYDLITCTDVLEHIDNDRGLLSKFHKALKLGGCLVIHVPTGGGAHPVIKNPLPDPHHVRPGYSKDELLSLLGSAGFSVENVRYTCGYLGAVAQDIFQMSRNPVPLRLLTFPLTAALTSVDVRVHKSDGQGVIAVATRRV